MSNISRILALASPALISLIEIDAQPLWVTGMPAVASTGPLSITINYGIDRLGTVYVIVFDYNNTSEYTSSNVRTRAIAGPSGSMVATAVLPVRKGSESQVLQALLAVKEANKLHTVFIVAADSRSVLQSKPVRLTATTMPCPQAEAGTGGNECDRNFVLNAVPQIGTGTWSKVTGPGNATFSPNTHTPGATVTVTQYGSYTFRWTESGGNCSSSDVVAVNFYQPPLANAGTGGNDCDNTFSLNAVPSRGTGRWSMTSGTGTAQFLPDPSNPQASVTVSLSGIKEFTWTETNGTCSSTSSVIVNFYQQPLADAGTGGNNCGLQFKLNAIPSVGTGTWTLASGPGNAQFSPNNNTPDALVTVTAFGTYTFRWTEVNNICSNSSTVNVNFMERVAANAGNGGHECDLDFLLNAVPGQGTGTWTKISGPGNATFIPAASQYNARVTVSLPGDYDFAWTEVSSNCSSTDIIRVTFHVLPPVNAGPDFAVCIGKSAQLNAAGTGTFLWSPANLLNNASVSNPVASILTTTHFNVTLTDQWGCRNSDRVTVEVKNTPVANAGPDQVLDYIFESSLSASPPAAGEQGRWSVTEGSGFFTSVTNPATNVKDLGLGMNAFLWTLTNGVCPDMSDTVRIIVKDLIIPTLLTPNGDGKNDQFIIRGIATLGKTGLVVFNRWGVRVYFTATYGNEWDGKDYNGNELPSDTYYFILKPEKSKTLKGYIVIKR